MMVSIGKNIISVHIVAVNEAFTSISTEAKELSSLLLEYELFKSSMCCCLMVKIFPTRPRRETLIITKDVRR